MRGGNSYTGRAEVLGENYDSAYAPIKGGNGQTLGMIFVGLPELRRLLINVLDSRRRYELENE